MQISTRIRLTLYFTALFGVIVASLAIASYLLIRNDAYSQLDSALQVATGATAMSAEHEFNEHSTKGAGETDVRSVLTETGNASLRHTQILVREGNRRVAYKGSKHSTTDLRTIDLGTLENRVTLRGLRIAYRELRVPKFHAVYQIYSARAIEPALSQLARLRVALLVLVPLGLGLAALAGYLLAQKSLAPIKELARTINAVTSTDLSARVAVTNPEDEIGALGFLFNSLLNRLEHAFNIQRRFMADASHEIRTPVTIALTAAQVTTRDADPSLRDCKESLQIIEQQMLRLGRIVQDMFFLSQEDTSSLKLNCREMYLDDAVSEAVQAAKTLARAKDQRLKLNTLTEARCLGDQDLLRQAILILLDNAVKFTPVRGNIEVALTLREQYWICSVTDFGIGISEEAQPRIFERFFRENQAGNGRSSGAGLGLAIAKSIVENHAGKLILVGSHPGLTTFEMAIPVFTEERSSRDPHENSLAVRM